MTRRVLPFGDRALLVELDSLPEVLALYPAVNASRPPGVTDVVPAARSILVRLDASALSLREAKAWLGRVNPRAAPSADEADEVTLDVDYSGPDLGEVARLLGRGPADVVALHTRTVWRVAFSGFSPGFAYLACDHDRLTVPRLATPRPEVPAGSVGLAGEFSGVYPRASPGGWRLIGRTDAVLWDAGAEAPALLTPGRIVRFRSTSP